MKAAILHPSLLLLLLTSLTGVCPRRPKEKYVRAGEMVALQCPGYRGYDHLDGRLIWTSHTSQEMDLTGDMSSAQQRETGVLVHGRSLVILNASVNHQGNYSCSQGNTSRKYWFKLMVYTTQTREYEEMTTHPVTCYTLESCTLTCPDVNLPAENIPNITTNGTIWHKEGESSLTASYFSSVEENDGGVYTCTRSYLYHGQIYNMTSTVKLEVQPKKKSKKLAEIISPRMSEVFPVDLGSTVVIDCQAVVYSEFDEVFWLMDDAFVKRDNSSPVFYKFNNEHNAEETKLTASLVFNKVSEEDLAKTYSCKLESESGPSSFVSITLAKKSSSLSLPLALSIVIIVMVIVLTVVGCVKFKMGNALPLQDALASYSSFSDGKSYDAFLMSYESVTDAGLNEDDRKWLERVLEDTFGYSLCRDISPGKAVEEAVLDCVQRSRMVVLVPTSSDPGPGAGMLKKIHAAFVKQQTGLVFIKTEATEARSGSLSEALLLFDKTGNCVTWRGKSSMSPCSSFWRDLRRYLPAPQHPDKSMLLSQTATQEDNC
ncbi:interleukin-18 receptor 1-like [Acanthopagrus latus]|uniref:interleukin-18 receptor 1-like n=1 Tax=Acanthopagrus latus TaxID=8177 RepID=UPI00187BD505|nr:interleukin-18 receptor 1-like [Acanthopagrus latus]XP_036952494.1 interleukin-18 receptor 1-like [Acanthopagrus latus]XP_036952495.1 interleukin-18 receptor 1-like [Acanthopagrus latus]